MVDHLDKWESALQVVGDLRCAVRAAIVDQYELAFDSELLKSLNGLRYRALKVGFLIEGRHDHGDLVAHLHPFARFKIVKLGQIVHKNLVNVLNNSVIVETRMQRDVRQGFQLTPRKPR